jgi:hypothetical protein
MIATTLFVVPRSMPMILPMIGASGSFRGRVASSALPGRAHRLSSPAARLTEKRFLITAVRVVAGQPNHRGRVVNGTKVEVIDGEGAAASTLGCRPTKGNLEPHHPPC